MTGRIRDVLPLAGGEWVLTIVTRDNPDPLKDKEVSIEPARKGRSKDANAICWALCSQIGKALTPPVDKEDVYRRAIRAVGVYSPVTVVSWDVEKIQHRWESHGVGWFVDVVDDAGTGRKLIHLYYGSSTYTVQEMRILVDWLMDECRQMQIAVPLSKADEERLLERWGKK